MKNGFIVTATDTNVGKTVFCAALVEALNANYWKPIQAGLDNETDLDTLKRLTTVNDKQLHAEAYRLKTPCSPHLAAQIDQVVIDPHELSIPTTLSNDDRPLIIEGAGGLLVPLTPSRLQIDQFKTWQLPIVLCARTQLGTINHTLLSVEAIKKRGLTLVGIAFVGDENKNTQDTIASFSGAHILGTLPMLDPLNTKTLSHAFETQFDTGDFLQTP